MGRKRAESLLVELIGRYFQKELPLTLTGVLVTITKVELTPKLDIAKVYVSLMGMNSLDKQPFIHDVLSEHHNKLKKFVASKLRHTLRAVPKELRFFVDEHQAKTFDIIQEIENKISSRTKKKD